LRRSTHFGLACGAEGRKQSKQIGDYPLLRGGGGVQGVLSRCGIYLLVLIAWFMQPAIKAQEQEQPQLVAGTERGTGGEDAALS
jgi:hypothetical protein